MLSYWKGYGGRPTSPKIRLHNTNPYGTRQVCWTRLRAHDALMAPAFVKKGWGKGACRSTRTTEALPRETIPYPDMAMCMPGQDRIGCDVQPRDLNVVVANFTLASLHVSTKPSSPRWTTSRLYQMLRRQRIPSPSLAAQRNRIRNQKHTLLTSTSRMARPHHHESTTFP
jgi:hypothetical protein